MFYIVMLCCYIVILFMIFGICVLCYCVFVFLCFCVLYFIFYVLYCYIVMSCFIFVCYVLSIIQFQNLFTFPKNCKKLTKKKIQKSEAFWNRKNYKANRIRKNLSKKKKRLKISTMKFFSLPATTGVYNYNYIAL